jgi:hypothetical protein
MICSNCKAEVPDGKGGKHPNGQFICCEHCFFNPLGCRCKYGEFGVAETFVDPEPLDPFVAKEFGLWDVFDYE